MGSFEQSSCSRVKDRDTHVWPRWHRSGRSLGLDPPQVSAKPECVVRVESVLSRAKSLGREVATRGSAFPIQLPKYGDVGVW